jgi:hypothetical protein
MGSHLQSAVSTNRKIDFLQTADVTPGGERSFARAVDGTKRFPSAAVSSKLVPRMRQKTLQAVAIAILALLGAPLAMHVVLHDLHHEHGDHHRDHDAGMNVEPTGHSDHDHPVIASSPAAHPAPARTFVATVIPPFASASAAGEALDRSLVSVPALRLDNDVGLQALFSTFLI